MKDFQRGCAFALAVILFFGCSAFVIGIDRITRTFAPLFGVDVDGALSTFSMGVCTGIMLLSFLILVGGLVARLIRPEKSDHFRDHSDYSNDDLFPPYDNSRL